MCKKPANGRKTALEILKRLGGGNFRKNTAINLFIQAEIQNPEKKFETLCKGKYILGNTNGTFRVA
jgi:hypothetical protein